MSFTNAQLAQKISDLIDYWSSFNKEYSDWQGGAVDGGPGSDGSYPLTDWYGNELLVKSPAKLQDDVDNITTGATAQANAAAASAAAASTSETNAAASAAAALVSETAADSSETAAAASASSASSSQTVATAQANLATDRAGYAQEWANLPYNTLVSAAAGGDEVDDYSARHWAEHAASLNPGASPQSYLRSDIADTADGVITFAANPVINVGANALSSLTIGEPTTLRGDAQDAGINLYGEHSGTIYGARIQVISSNMQVTGVGANQVGNLQLDFDLQFLNSHSISGVNNITASGAVTGSNLNVSNWDTAYGWGDHSVAGYGVKANAQTVSGAWRFQNNSGYIMEFSTGANSGSSSHEMHFIDRLGTGAGPEGQIMGSFKAERQGTGAAMDFVWGLVDNVDTDAAEVMRLTQEGNLAVVGNVTGANLNVSNWDTAYGWGDHSTQNYAVTTGDTFTGSVTFNGSVFGALKVYESRQAAGFSLDTAMEDAVFHMHNSTGAGHPSGETLAYGSMLVLDNSDVHSQLYFSRHDDGRLYTRSSNASPDLSGVGWNRLWSDADFDYTTFAPLASPTFTGTVNMSTLNAGNIDSSGTITASSYHKVDAADGNGFGFWNGAPSTYGIYMSAAGNGTYGGRVTGETTSDYNIYFEMNSGTNRGFVFETDAAKLFSVNPSGIYSGRDLFYIQGKEAIDGSDTWLRLNQNNDFTSGVYTPYALRADGGLYFNSSDVVQRMTYAQSGMEYWDRYSQSVTAGTWYTIASDPSGLDITTDPVGKSGASRSASTFRVWDTTSGQHGYCEFMVSCNYGRRPTVTILNHSSYGSSSSVLRGIRIVRYSTYNGTAVQVQAGSTGTMSVAVLRTGTAGFYGRTPVSQTPHASWYVEDIDYIDYGSNWPAWGVWTGPAVGADGPLQGVAWVADNQRFYPSIKGSGNGYFEPVTGSYGSVQVDGAAGSSGTWGGYSLQGEYVFMSYPGVGRCGIYNDVDNEWMVQWYRNADMKMYYNNVNVADTHTDGLRRTSKGSFYHNESSSYLSGGVTFSTSAASGGQSGDIWFQYT